MRAWLAAIAVAAMAALLVAVLGGAGGNPGQATAYAAPVTVLSLSGFAHPLPTTTTTAPPERHIASIPSQPVISYPRPAEFQAGYKVPKYVATTFPTTTTDPPATTAYDPATAGMGTPGSFQACVAWNESTDGQASSDVYGILPFVWNDVIGFAGSPYYASLATQDAAFWRLYDMDGTSPWAPYDGC